jgi:hypothetical protein
MADMTSRCIVYRSTIVLNPPMGRPTHRARTDTPSASIHRRAKAKHDFVFFRNPNNTYGRPGSPNTCILATALGGDVCDGRQLPGERVFFCAWTGLPLFDVSRPTSILAVADISSRPCRYPTGVVSAPPVEIRCLQTGKSLSSYVRSGQPLLWLFHPRLMSHGC